MRVVGTLQNDAIGLPAIADAANFDSHFASHFRVSLVPVRIAHPIRELHGDGADVELIIAMTCYKTFNDSALCARYRVVHWLRFHTPRLQAAPVPFPGDKNFRADRQRLRELWQSNACPVHHGGVAFRHGNNAQQARTRDRGYCVQARCDDDAAFGAQAADTYRCSGLDRRKVWRDGIFQAYGLAHDLYFTRGRVYPGNRTLHGINYADAVGAEQSAHIAGADDNQLAHGQIAGRGRLAIYGDRRAGVVVHFHVVDANAGKAGDDAHDAGAAHPS